MTNQFPPPIQVFNKYVIAEWKSEQGTIKNKITVKNKQINTYNQTVAKYLKTEEKEIFKLQQTIADLKTQQFNVEFYYPKVEKSQNKSANFNLLDPKKRLKENLEITNKIKQLEQKRDECELKLKTNTSKRSQANVRDHYKESIKNSDRLSTLIEKDVELTSAIERASRFLECLEKSPQRLIDEFGLQINKVCEEYEFQHPSSQSIGIRLALRELKENTELVCNRHFRLNSKNKLTNVMNNLMNEKNHNERLNYLLLCGLLGSVVAMLNKEDPEDGLSLFNSVLILIRKTHVPFNGDLPDEFALSKHAIDFYERNFPRQSETDLLELERQDLNKITGEFLAHLKRRKEEFKDDADLCNEGLKLCQAIEDEKLTAIYESKVADTKYFTSVLEKANDLLSKPADEDAQEQFLHLASCDNNGKQMQVKRLTGKILSFAGIVIISATIIGVFALMSLASGGLYTGIQIAALAFGVTAVGATSGSALCAFGVGLFQNTRAKTIKHEVENFSRLALST